MFIRFARFEGADPATRAERVEQLRSSIEAVRDGGAPEGMPPQAAETLRSSVTRVLNVADHRDGSEGSAIFCATEDDLRSVDAILDAMTPPGGDGRRASVAHYEVLLDVEM